MLDYSIMMPEGVLVLKPRAPLTAADFGGVSAAVDAYLINHSKLHGVLIHAEEFPGWENFDGFSAHLHFVREHHRDVERIAVVSDSWLASLAESIGQHFTSAEVKHFGYPDDGRALDWLETHDSAESIEPEPASV